MILSKINSKELLKTTFGILLFKTVLELMYVIYICPKHNNRGFVYDPTILSIVFSWLSTILIIPLVHKFYQSTWSSAKVATLWLLLMYVPSTTIFGYINADLLLWELFLVYWLVLLLLLLLTYRLKLPSLPQHLQKHSNMILLGIAVFFSGIVLFVSIYYFHFRLSLNISNVTEARAHYKSVKISGIFSYLLPIANTILPLVMLYFLAKKNYLIGVFLLIVLLIDFGIAGHRVVLLKTILCLVGFFAYKLFITKNFVYYLVSVIVASLLVYFVLDQVIFTSLTRRALFVPGLLNFEYYDFFVQHPPDFYRQGIIGSLTGQASPYSEGISTIIGENYMGVGSHNVANNGLFSDAIANFGPKLLFIQAILLVIYLKLFDWASNSLDKKFEFLPVIIIAQTLISAMVTTSLLTHGLLMLIVVLLFFPREKAV